MAIVRTIRRMLALRDGIRRCPITNDRYDDVWEALNDKYESLLKALRDYRKCKNRCDREERIAASYRRRQVDLACRLLGVHWYNL